MLVSILNGPLISGKRPRLWSCPRHDDKSGRMEERNLVTQNDAGANEGSQTESLIKNRYWKCVSIPHISKLGLYIFTSEPPLNFLDENFIFFSHSL